MRKVGIVTLHTYNYGSLLQCYALALILKKLGYDAVVINVQYGIVDKLKKYISFTIKCIKYPSKFFRYIKVLKRAPINLLDEETKINMVHFEKKKLNSVILKYSQWCKIANQDEYHLFISGSDQIWNNMGMRFEPFNFLQFAPKHKCVAYAPSFGVKSVPKYEIKTLKRYLQKYQFIAVREKTGADIILNILGEAVPVVLDPTLLIDKKQWIGEVDQYSAGEESNIIFIYFLDEPNEKAKNFIKEIYIQNDLIIEVWGYQCKEFSNKNVRIMHDDPSAFVRSLSRSRLVVTDSYHAMIFSINFKIDFWVFERNYRQGYSQSIRIIDLLDRIGLNNRYIIDEYKADTKEECNFTAANVYLTNMRKISMEYLEKVLAEGFTHDY